MSQPCAPDEPSQVGESCSDSKGFAGDGVSFARNYVERVVNALKRLDLSSVDRVAKLFLEARNNDATIFFLGNGGSAATASHFANDMGFGASPEGKTPFRALSLTANNAFLTCLAKLFQSTVPQPTPWWWSWVPLLSLACMCTIFLENWVTKS